VKILITMTEDRDAIIRSDDKEHVEQDKDPLRVRTGRQCIMGPAERDRHVLLVENDALQRVIRAAIQMRKRILKPSGDHRDGCCGGCRAWNEALAFEAALRGDRDPEEVHSCEDPSCAECVERKILEDQRAVELAKAGAP